VQWLIADHGVDREDVAGRRLDAEAERVSLVGVADTGCVRPPYSYWLPLFTKPRAMRSEAVRPREASPPGSPRYPICPLPLFVERCIDCWNWPNQLTRHDSRLSLVLCG
jgi:hypothetical protein